ncbi:MAG: hypothetical protein KIT73_13505, partial [Burkholderiales bacterium]|nr:hypothetical protein [Burkholderiales bacterium]
MTAPLLPPPIPTGNTRRVLTTLRDGSVVAARRGGRIAGRTLKWTLIAIGVLVTLIAAFVIYVAVVGVSVDAAPLRGRIAEAFTKALGRTVDF